MTASNFAVLDKPLPELAAIGRDAEKAFPSDPRAAMGHLRLFGERLTMELLDLHRQPTYQEPQYERLLRLRRDCNVEGFPIDHLHTLRKEGNKAVHGRGIVGHGEAMTMLKAATSLAAWFWRNHSTQPPPPPGPFVKPTAADKRTDRALQRQLEAEQARAAAEQARAEAARSELDKLQRMLEMPEVATHTGLHTAFEALQGEDRTRFEGFLKRFREEPIRDDAALVQPEGMADDKVRLVALDGLSVVVIAPSRGDLLMVVWVAPHDDAVAWAAGKRFEVNPVLGTLQLYDVDEAEAVAEDFAGGLFDAHDDEALARVGVPAKLLEPVRAVASESDLDELSPHLPPEVADALYLLASGHDLTETLRELDLERPPPEPVDADDFATAVHHPESRRSFALLDDDADLDAVLAGPIDAWRVYLHPDQRKLVSMKANGPVRVLGGAGTGKTVALLHRAKHLVNGVYGEPDDRLLVTTFTKNLAADLRHQLAKLVDGDAMARIDCVHLDGYISELWRSHGDGRRVAFSDTLEPHWGRAMRHDSLDLGLPFYKAEWEQVVQSQAVTDELGYLRARRRGRGVRLDRGKRQAVWQVFAAYRAGLDDAGVAEKADLLHVLRAKLDDGTIPREFVSVLCDEVQDLGAPELLFVRALVPTGSNDLFFVGDAHQRIYGHEVQMGRCGIEIRGRARRLRVNYRTTARVRAWAVAALEGEAFDDMDGGEDTLDGYRSLRVGIAPSVHLEASRAAEERAVVDAVRAWLDAGIPAAEIGVAGPTNTVVRQLLKALSAADIEASQIESDASVEGDGVRVATFARLKGLEFPRVLLAGVSEGLVPLRPKDFYRMSEEDKALFDRRQRCLLYVAATRARDELVVVGSKKSPSPFLVQLRGHVAPAPEVVPETATKSCPRCGTVGPIEEVFGFRKVKRVGADGSVAYAKVPQSYCRSCRSSGGG